MSRYIDADALINDLEYDIAIDTDILNYVGTEGNERINTQFDKDCKQNAIDLLMRTPTIDAVEVVRCKDCKWWVEHSSKFGSAMFCDHDCSLGGQGIKNPDDFCSYGERKEE